MFPYSRRAGTPAYDFPDQIPEHEKEARSRRMTAAVEEVRAQVAATIAGRRAEVLLETPLSANTFTGYTKQYLPVVVCAPGHASGDIVTVTLGEWDGHRCHARTGGGAKLTRSRRAGGCKLRYCATFPKACRRGKKNRKKFAKTP